jgi:hypothetical protein
MPVRGSIGSFFCLRFRVQLRALNTAVVKGNSQRTSPSRKELHRSIVARIWLSPEILKMPDERTPPDETEVGNSEFSNHS